MAQSSMNVSIVEYYGEQGKSKCGYCKQRNSCNSHGMRAHCLTNQDYQDLIDRGWRRSGTYCYKPKNDETCCPCYTIKCDVSSFNLSKSQKKIIKRLNNFLLNGQKGKMEAPNQIEYQPMDCNSPQMESNQPINDFDVEKAKEIVSRSQTTGDGRQSCENVNNSESDVMESDDLKKVDECMNTGCSSGQNIVTGPDVSKPLRKKAKLMRMERKAQKLGVANLSQGVSKKQPQNVKKNLETLLNEVEGTSRHKLEVKLFSSEESSKCPEVFKLYRKYQVAVHNDPPEKLTKSSFERFLVISPLKVKLLPVAGNQKKICTEELPLYKIYQTVIHNDDEPSATDFEEFLISSPLEAEESTSPTVSYGSFHQQYWLDDKLIAVGVIDILPSCVSSVYFFYDPDFRFLSLGTYGSLREIYLVQQLQQQVNSIDSYYMGFYIHSCPKMRYKGKLTGSFLLCPEAYTWHVLDDDVIQRLNESKYQRLNKDLSVQDANQFTPDDLNRIKILLDAKVLMTFPQFADTYLTPQSRSVFMNYGQLVGKSVSAKLVQLIF